MKKIKAWGLTCLFLLTCHHIIPCNADHHKKIKSRRSHSPPSSRDNYNDPVYLLPQEGLREADKIESLPGQPDGVDFDQYSGYVTVDPTAGRALFYYFVESPHNSSSKPLLLWINGGSSSLGGAMMEIGPFRVNRDRKTLFRNEFAWNEVANVLFLEFPVGVGFSYTNSSEGGRSTSDKRSARESYAFIVNWLKRFPQYSGRDFFMAGEYYAGHYVPQLAEIILSNNNCSNHTTACINLKGIALGNALLDDIKLLQGLYDYYWSHAMISDKTHARIVKYCDFINGKFTNKCIYYQGDAEEERGEIDNYNIYGPLCSGDSQDPNYVPYSIRNFDPCSIIYITEYLGRAEVQKALHAGTKTWWEFESTVIGRPTTVLPTIKRLIRKGLDIWLYSGDMDGRVPVTSTRYAINALELSAGTRWRAWYEHNREVGGYVEGHKGLIFVTIRGAGHSVPSYQPERALTVISCFLQGILPPTIFLDEPQQ